MICHHFKHVISDIENRSKIDNIPISSCIFKCDTEGRNNLMPFRELHNIYFVFREAIKFIETQAEIPNSPPISLRRSKGN